MHVHNNVNSSLFIAMAVMIRFIHLLIFHFFGKILFLITCIFGSNQVESSIWASLIICQAKTIAVRRGHWPETKLSELNSFCSGEYSHPPLSSPSSSSGFTSMHDDSFFFSCRLYAHNYKTFVSVLLFLS